MDGISDQFSQYPLSVDTVTGGQDWGQWFDRLVNTWAQYRIIKSNDVTRQEGQPQSVHPGQVSVSGSINATTIMLLAGAGVVLYLLVRK